MTAEMTSSIVKKLQVGERLADDEFRVALRFYGELYQALALLGPTFDLAANEVSRVHRQLVCCKSRKETA